jgi:hypothetical protein
VTTTRAHAVVAATLGALVWLAGAGRAAAQTPAPPDPVPSPAASPAPAAPKGKAPKEPIVVRDHRTIRSYPANLGHNMLEVWSRPSFLPVVIGASAMGLAAPLDDNVVQYFEDHPMKTYGNIGKFLGTGAVAVGVSAAVLGVGHYSNGDRFRAATYDMGQAVVVNFLYTLAIKESVRRERPDKSDNLSFPSGHASNAFACATVWAEQYGWKGAVPGYLGATLIAGSRLALAKHHLSDIIGGAALGVVVGQSVVRWDKKPSHKPGPGEPHVWLAPAAAPDGSGLGLAISGTF